MAALLMALLASAPASDTDPVASYELMRLGLCAPKALPSGEYALVEPGIVAVPCAGMPLELIEYDELYLRLGDEETASGFRTRDRAAVGLYIGAAALGVASVGTLFYGGSRDADWVPALPFSLLGGTAVSLLAGYLVDNWREDTPHDLHARLEAHNAELRADLDVVEAGDEVELMRRQLHQEVAAGATPDVTADLAQRIEVAENFERRSIHMRRQFVVETYSCGAKQRQTCTAQYWRDPRPHLGNTDDPLDWDRFYELIGRDDIVDAYAWRRVTKNVGWGTAVAGMIAMPAGLLGMVTQEDSNVPWDKVAIAGVGAFVTGALVGWLLPNGDYADSELAAQLTEEYNERLRSELEDGAPEPVEEEEQTDDDEDWNA